MSFPWQPGSVLLNVVLHHWTARPRMGRKPPAGRKDLLHISYTNRLIADFVPNFVAMATGVGRGRICLASFNSPTPKSPCYMQRSQGYLLYRPSYSRFCPKFRCHGNRDWSQQNLSDIIQLPDYENPLLCAKISGTSRIQAELQPILSQISFPWQRGLVAVDFVWRHSIAQPRKPPARRKGRRDISI